MISPAQKTLYFREWQATAQALGWTRKETVLTALQNHHAGQVWESPALTEVIGKIYELALRSAAAQDRSVEPNDLRRACSAIALGRQASSKHFSNSDFDKVLALLRLLADPTNLQNLLTFQDPESGERKRHLFAIRRADGAYVARLVRDKFDTANIENLTLVQLRQLSLTLRHRPRAYIAPKELIAA